MSVNNQEYNTTGKKGYCVMYFFIFLILFILLWVMISNRNYLLEFK